MQTLFRIRRIEPAVAALKFSNFLVAAAFVGAAAATGLLLSQPEPAQLAADLLSFGN